MHSSYALLFLAPFAAQLASAKCYKSGDEADKSTANNDLDTKCRSFQGFFENGQWRQGCTAVDSSNKYWYVEVKRTGSGSGTLTLEKCKENLGKEVNGCSKGGDSEHDGFNFR